MIDSTWTERSFTTPAWAEFSAAPTTGRYIVVFADADEDPVGVLRSAAGLANVATSADFTGGAVDVAQTATADATVFTELRMAVVTADPNQIAALQTSTTGRGAVLSVSPELIHHVMPSSSVEYLSGYTDGVADLGDRLRSAPGPRADDRRAAPAEDAAPYADTAQATWGLQATHVLSSPCSGRGVSVAVLDTGFDAGHPDFGGRTITAQSFITGETPQDGHGHGTHCIGTSCGPKAPAGGPRYGIAYDADIFVGKVLDNTGSGADGGILLGINWAVANRCQVISMSFGADVPQVHPPYVAAGRRALDKGCLMVAAAGNNADRRAGNVGFVGAPANSPDVLAVAALDHQLDVTFFSARTLVATRGGQIDVAAPGWQVYSAWPMPQRYRSISGTSMATPHVAGLAALWSQQTGRRGRELWATLAQEGQRLLAQSADVGGGLPLAPQ